MRRLGFTVAVALPLLALLVARAEDPPTTADKYAYDAKWEKEPGSSGCVSCHQGIEEVHPAAHLTCVSCHGGDATATTKEKAHVQPIETPPNDERVLAADWDLKWQRFENPSNLRVVKDACGDCHDPICRSVPRSLHGTTAGHLNDGLYENGIALSKKAGFSIFDVTADPKVAATENALRLLSAIPAGGDGPRTSIATHFKDVPRKACMRCHLYGRGRGVRGRLGMDGDYRSEGCAACHVNYGDDGLSHSRDKSASKFEPGHPIRHELTSKIPTSTCTHCHYGDASIGLHFRGLAQLAPGMPGGPRVPGTTPRRINGTYYIQDTYTPPDIHHEKGLACIDCHMDRETMGDGQVYGYMEHGTETTCETCHGGFTGPATFKTKKGNVLKNLQRDGEQVFLIGKLDGKRHVVPQAFDVITPGRPGHNSHAAAAMTNEHARVACYACHSSWNVDFFGFHLDRHEGFTMLDCMNGRRTAGRVTTMEKVFATTRQLTLGWDSSGRISTYIVGFSTMCTVHDKDGKTVLDQQMPETAGHLSGMTMVHHQVHTVRKRARECVECHRSSEAWGMGSASFRLMRSTVFGGTEHGLESIVFDRKNPPKSVPNETLPIEGGVTRVAVLEDAIQGHARWIALAGRDAVLLVDGRTMKVTDRVPIAGATAFGWLGRKHVVVAAGPGGLSVVKLPERPSEKAKVVGKLDLKNPLDLELSFRTAYVADQSDGLVVVDLDEPEKPRVVSKLDLRTGGEDIALARRIALDFQFSRVRDRDAPRTKARHLAFVACGTAGIKIVDVTQPERPKIIGRDRNRREDDKAEIDEVAYSAVFDLGSEGGGIPSRERDYIYALAKKEDGNFELRVIDVDDPRKPERAGTFDLAGPGRRGLALAHVYNAPFLQHLAIIGMPEGAEIVDVTRRGQPTLVGRLKGNPLSPGKPNMEPTPVPFSCVALESFPLDKMIDEDGLPMKDISHPNARYLSLEELRKVLSTKLPEEESK
ncbi:MAG TPA: hypothetical protein VFF73_17295 [Planctomycetota bacterium]|nr:hypothetical protein [Planctomycetota bacterium]